MTFQLVLVTCCKAIIVHIVYNYLCMVLYFSALVVLLFFFFFFSGLYKAVHPSGHSIMIKHYLSTHSFPLV